MNIKIYRGIQYVEIQPDLFEVLCPCGCENIISMNYSKNDKYGEVRVIDILDNISDVWEDIPCLALVFHGNDESEENTSYLFGD